MDQKNTTQEQINNTNTIIHEECIMSICDLLGMNDFQFELGEILDLFIGEKFIEESNFRNHFAFSYELQELIPHAQLIMKKFNKYAYKHIKANEVLSELESNGGEFKTINQRDRSELINSAYQLENTLLNCALNICLSLDLLAKQGYISLHSLCRIFEFYEDGGINHHQNKEQDKAFLSNLIKKYHEQHHQLILKADKELNLDFSLDDSISNEMERSLSQVFDKMNNSYFNAKTIFKELQKKYSLD